MSRSFFHSILLCMIALSLTLCSTVFAASPYVWIEGEKPTRCNVEPQLNGWGNADFLSEDNWLSITIDKNKVEADAPADGVLIDYDFTVSEASKHEVWARIGFEFVRSPFDWRIDDRPWKRVEPTELTTDLMEIAFWCEVAWLKLGNEELSSGKHRLTIRLPKTKNEKGETQVIRAAFDAFCLSAGAFHPNSKYKPDEDYRTDADRAAAENVFKLEAPEGESRSSVELAGQWEICRDDEHLPMRVDAPIERLPSHPNWSAITVPGDKNKLRPDLLFAHRLWYKTRVEVPEDCAGRSFFLVFPQNNLNTTVYVNGQLCGFDKNPFARVQIDISRAVKPGVNEICVGIRDAWYGYTLNPKDPMKFRRRFNLPKDYLGHGFQDLSYPVWHHAESGILVTPSLVCAGRDVYLSDVFCKPSVAKKQLGLELTLTGTKQAAMSGDIVCEAIRNETGNVEKQFTPIPFSLGPGEVKTIDTAQSWTNASLWWPDDPQLYTLTATVRVAGKPVDQSDTTFGFREWTRKGKDFLLNGIVWHGWADCFRADSPEQWLEFYRKTNQTVMRFWGTKWQGLAPEEALDFFDRGGVVCRRSGMLDGEAIGYYAIEHDPYFKELYGSDTKIDLFRNVKDQVIAQVRGERNHPSVMIWSIENEFLYINCINLHGKYMDEFETEITKISDAVMGVDPTRPTMVDGGGACKANTLPVQGDHYVFKDYTKYPDQAYDANVQGGGRGRWEWDLQRPRFIGEDYFANGINPFDYSYFGGEETFGGKAQSRRAAGIIYRMLMEGYRWAEYGAWHFWMGQNEAIDQYGSNAPRAVFCRQWDWTLESGGTVKRTMRIFNDTRYGDPITMKQTLVVGGKTISSSESTYRIAPGSSKTFEVDLTMPAVADRTEGSWNLELLVGGETVFTDTKDVSVINTKRSPTGCNALRKMTAAQLIVVDPDGATVDYLSSLGVKMTRLAEMPDDLLAKYPQAKVVLIGPGVIEPTTADSPQLQALALEGMRIVVLEQTSPLCYSAIPTDARPDTNEGRTAFAVDMGHPAFTGMDQKDFFTFAGDHVVYRDAYVKPTRGAKTLLQCDERLARAALLEAPVDQGVMLLCQAVVGEKVDTSPVVRRLLLNLLDYAADYRLTLRDTIVCTRDLSPQAARFLDDIKLRFSSVDDPVEAIGDPGAEPHIAIITASPANLKRLLAAGDKVERFFQSGGQLVLIGLTPEGLADYNKLLGVEHIIRPFWRERMTFPPVRNPLTVGLSTGDIVMLSGERIFGWTKDEFVADDIFSYVVDYEDVAPFAEYPDDFTKLMCNGMVSADAWKYIVNLPTPEPGTNLEFPLKLLREETIEKLEWIGNTFYYPVTKAALIFDGNEEDMFVFETEPNNDPQMIELDRPRKGKVVTLRLLDWEIIPEKRPVTGLDNIKLFAARDEAFRKRVKPMLGVGGLMQYVIGNGGAVLCNLNYQDAEPVPENRGKKLKILSTVLRNLHATFAEGKTIVAGGNYRYSPVDIAGKCTQYRDEKGWFGDKQFTFAALPVGDQQFAGVPFNVYDFPTSPTPTAIMLRGRGTPGNLPESVDGISVGKKADAIFFLHTAKMDRRRNDREIKEGKMYDMAKYVVHYADGKSVDIPIYAEIDIDDYRQTEPRIIPGATLAWVRPYEGTDQSAVAYMKQWNNPRPDVEISSIDIKYGENCRGTPAVLAITTAVAE